MQVVLAEEIGIDAVALGVRTHPRQSGAHGLLHHFAQMPGHGELLSAAHLAGFDEDDVSADRRPDEPDGNSRLLNALFDFFLDAELFRDAERFANHFGRDDQLFRLAFGDAPCLFADERGDFAFEVPHARFTRVAVNQVAQRLVGEFDLFAQHQTVFLGLARESGSAWRCGSSPLRCNPRVR